MRAAATFLAVILLAQQTTAFAQAPAAQSVGAWGDIKSLPVGEELSVKLKDGRSVKGKLVSVRDADLVVKSGKSDVVLERENVFQVYRRIAKSRKNAVAIGAAVGGGLGVAGGAVSDGAGDLSQPGATILAMAVYAGVGALIGWAVGAGKKQLLIYQAQK